MTPLGEGLLQALMQRGMMIDVAHLPQRSLGRAYELLEASEYPVLKTHGNTNDGRIYLHGGMAGAGLGRCASANNPGGMGAGLAGIVAQVAAKGGYPSEGLSFDLNGFAGGPRPRFGPDSSCGEPQENPVTYPFTSYDGAVSFDEPQLGSRAVDFNTEGMIHIGLLPELIEDVRRDGVTDEELEPLFRSAEGFVRLWEYAEARGKALAP
jgi:microsomal dipeptidase-like Zn-dependent dipeptidase